MLLFGKAYIYDNMFFDYRRLVDEGLLTVLPLKEYDAFESFAVERSFLIEPVFGALEYTMHGSKDPHGLS